MQNRSFVDRLPAVWLGVGIATTLLAVLVIIETVLGRWQILAADPDLHALSRVSEGVLRDIRIAIVHCLVVGYVPAAFVHVLKSARRTVLALQDALDCTPEECMRLAASIRLRPRTLAVTGLLGLALAIMMPYFVPPVPEHLWNPAAWSPEVAWHRILGPLAMIAQIWLGYTVIVVSIRLSKIAEGLKRVDLLDLGSLAPFTRLGLSNALILIGLPSIWSLMLLETGFVFILIMIVIATFVGVTLAVVAPAVGVHRRITQVKDNELDWVNARIRDKRNAMQGANDSSRTGELADLVAYRNLVEDVPEWPFTTSTYARIGAYAIIPLFAWGMGVIAEELVGRLLF